MGRPGDRAAILVCDGHGHDEHGHDEHGHDEQGLTETVALLTTLAPGSSVKPVRSLCTGSRALSAALRRTRSELVILLACRYHRDRLRADELRERAYDWSIARDRVVVIDADGSLADDTEQATKLDVVAAAAAAVTGPSVSAILNVAVPRQGGIDRRALLTGRLHAHVPRPRLDLGPCAASPLCHLCVDSCSASALRMTGGSPTVVENSCDGCGACVLACPQGLLHLATLPRLVWETYLRHALVTAREVGLPLGVWWTCADAEEAAKARPGTAWLRLRVPCVRALTPAWVLQPLAAGASAATVTGCAAAQATWGEQGTMSRLVRVLVQGAPGTGRYVESLTLREPAGTADALVNLADPDRGCVASERAPLGLVSCVAQSCTSCGICAERCPTRALVVTEGMSSWTLTFNHAACAACGACVAACPEHALILGRGIEPTALRMTRELVSTMVRRCVICGLNLAAPALTARLARAGVHVPDDGICGDCRAAGRTIPQVPAASA